jgi:hypothetical protein
MKLNHRPIKNKIRTYAQTLCSDKILYHDNFTEVFNEMRAVNNPVGNWAFELRGTGSHEV